MDLTATSFGSRVPVILGIPTIKQITNIIKESESNELLASLDGSKMAQLLACWQAELVINREATTHQTQWMQLTSWMQSK